MTGRDDDAIDAMIERMAREEQDDIDRQHGQGILDQLAARGEEAHKHPFALRLQQAYKDRAADKRQGEPREPGDDAA
jgi:hypothetical protein